MSDDNQPNILLIVADQLVASLTGAYGHEVVKTPNLDRLAAEVRRFGWGNPQRGQIDCANGRG